MMDLVGFGGGVGICRLQSAVDSSGGGEGLLPVDLLLGLKCVGVDTRCDLGLMALELGQFIWDTNH